MKTIGIILLTVIITIVALVVVFGGVFIVGNAVFSTKIVKPNLEAGIDNAILDCKSKNENIDLCYLFVFQEAKMSNSLSFNESIKICDMISYPISEQCYGELLNDVKDTRQIIDICKKLSDDYNKMQCRNKIYSIITNSDNPETILFLCTQITEEKSYCYERVITIIKDKDILRALSLCSKVENKNSCYHSLLLGISERVKKYPDKAIETCKIIGENVDSCLNNVAWNIKISHPNKALNACSYIDDYVMKEGCYQSVWFAIPNNVRSDFELSLDLCDGFISANSDQCYFNVADIMLDVSRSSAKVACVNIQNEDQQKYCLTRVDKKD